MKDDTAKLVEAISKLFKEHIQGCLGPDDFVNIYTASVDPEHDGNKSPFAIIVVLPKGLALSLPDIFEGYPVYVIRDSEPSSCCGNCGDNSNDCCKDDNCGNDCGCDPRHTNPT